MPKTSITHEPWCAEHIGPEVGVSQTCCTAGARFGPLMPERPGDVAIENDTRGTLFVHVLDDEVDVSAGQDQQSDRVEGLRMCRARTTQVAAEDRPRGSCEQVCPTTGHRFERGDRLSHRNIGVREASSRTVQGDLKPDVGAHTTAL